MTTIAWDGKTLAADRLVLDSLSWRKFEGLHAKILRGNSGNPPELIATTGGAPHGLLLKAWWLGDAEPVNFPIEPRKDDEAFLYIFRADRIIVFQNCREPSVMVPGIAAHGMGGAYALGAMAMGASAAQAVEVAHRFDAATGPCADVLSL